MLKKIARTSSITALPPHLIGTLFAFLSAAIFAILNLAIRFSDPCLTVWHMMFGRSLFGVFAMVLLARCLKTDLLGCNRGQMTITGLTGMAGITCLTGSLILIPLFQALLLLYLYPAFAALLSPLVAGEEIGKKDWLFCAVAFSGTVMIIWTGQIQGGIQWGHLLGLAAAFAYGLYITLVRRLSSRNHSLVPYFYISCAGVVVCTAPLLAQQEMLCVGTTGLFWMLILAVLGAGAHLASNKALYYLPSPRVGVISMTEVFFGGIFGFLFFDESVGWRSILGGVLILSSAVCLTVKTVPLATKAEGITKTAD